MKMLFRIRHPGTMKYLYFETRAEAEKYYEGFNSIVEILIKEIK